MLNLWYLGLQPRGLSIVLEVYGRVNAWLNGTLLVSQQSFLQGALCLMLIVNNTYLNLLIENW
jgi:hypothetical protein